MINLTKATINWGKNQKFLFKCDRNSKHIVSRSTFLLRTCHDYFVRLQFVFCLLVLLHIVFIRIVLTNLCEPETISVSPCIRSHKIL